MTFHPHPVRRLRRLVPLAAAACLILAATAHGGPVNLIVNGDFEAGNTGFESDFTNNQTNITGAGTYAVVDDPSTVHPSATSYGDHTSGSGLMQAVNGTTDTTSVFWRQTVAVDAGTNYDFGLWTSTWFGGASSLRLLVNDAALGDFLTPTSNGVWEQSTFGWFSGGATSATFELVNTSNAFTGNDFAVDDITLFGEAVPGGSAVPEPASMLLFSLTGLGLAGGGLRRRFGGGAAD